MSRADLPTVTFVTRTLHDKWPDIAALEDCEQVAERVRRGVDVWIIRTYVELKHRAAQFGFRVAIDNQFPEGRPAITHRDELRLNTRYFLSYLAVVRADRPNIHLAPWQIVQNPLQASDHAVFIPHWPQPGLIPRDPHRSGISTLRYFGRASSLPGFFRDPAFLDALAQRGISFHFDERDWRDYASTDVCVALRYEPEIGTATKPFSKLVNAWIAGVPALLGPEPAYRAVRRSELDFIEVNSAREVLAALDLLRTEPQRYDAMVANGRARAADYSRTAIADQWCRFIAGQFLPGWRTWRDCDAGPLALRWDIARRLARQALETRRYKRREAAELAHLRACHRGESLDS